MKAADDEQTTRESDRGGRAVEGRVTPGRWEADASRQ